MCRAIALPSRAEVRVWRKKQLEYVCSLFADWLILQASHPVFEGDDVTLRCLGKKEKETYEKTYYKNKEEMRLHSQSEVTIHSVSRDNNEYPPSQLSTPPTFQKEVSFLLVDLQCLFSQNSDWLLWCSEWFVDYLAMLGRDKLKVPLLLHHLNSPAFVFFRSFHLNWSQWVKIIPKGSLGDWRRISHIPRKVEKVYYQKIPPTNSWMVSHQDVRGSRYQKQLEEPSKGIGIDHHNVIP